MSASVFQTLRALFSPTDEQLMWRVQIQDDAAAFAELVGRWQEPIRRLCTRMTGDSHRAEDLSQEVFLKLFSHRKTFQQGARLSTYLWRIAINHCQNELRRARHRYETLAVVDPESDETVIDRASDAFPGPDQQAVDLETVAVIRQALDALPEPHRAIVVLRHYEGLKFREIAEVLDVPEGTVKTRMTEALTQLARLLRKRLDLKSPPPLGSRQRSKEAFVL